ncbi:MAG: FliM/FliN family flagellar motor switch protein [Deltaproteobacteria bacterium]|nr:FliM/FliN family flagellar motor switch protein [Deltaproteobacteria bacterium]
MTAPLLTSDEVQALRELAGGPAQVGPEDLELGRSDRTLRRHSEALERKLLGFATAAGHRVARLMRSGCKTTPNAVDLLGPEIAAEILAAQAVVTELRLPSQQPLGYLGLDVRMCEAIIERTFGAPTAKAEAATPLPAAADSTRKITPLGQAIIQPTLPLLAADLARDLGGRHGLTLSVGPTQPGSAIVLPAGMIGLFVWRCDLAFGGTAASVTVVLLPSIVELTRHHEGATAAGRPMDAIARQLQNASLTVSATLGTARLAMADLLELRQGDVLRLDRGRDDHLPVSVAGVVKFFGRPTQHSGALAVTIEMEAT